MEGYDMLLYIFATIICLLIVWAIISSATSGIKKELKRQTHIMGLMAQQAGVKADALNDVMMRY